MKCRIFVTICWLWIKAVADIFIDMMNIWELGLQFTVTSVIKDSVTSVFKDSNP